MREVTFGRVIILVAVLCAGGVLPCAGDILYVDGDAPGAGDGSSWENAYHYLQDALADASSGDEIRVAAGIYTPDTNSVNPSGSGDREATFQLLNEVTIVGGYAGYGEVDPNERDVSIYETILSGDLNGDDGPDFANNSENSYHVLVGSGRDSSAVLEGVTITEGNADGSYFQAVGAGLYSYDGTPTVVACTFVGNKATSGGGGIYTYGYSIVPTVINCWFICNLGGTRGGGIYNVRSSPKLANCAFVGNHAGQGGAIHNYRDQSHPTLINCTVFANTAAIGGGIKNYDNAYPYLKNTILWGNSDNGGMDESAQIDGESPSFDYSCVQGWTGVFGGIGNTGSDPMFIDPNGADGIAGTGDDDLHLLVESPCIDAGDNSVVPPSVVSDLEGSPRIVNGVVDMGAYENVDAGPVIGTSPLALEFSALEGGEDPADQILSIWNVGIGTLNWQISEDCDWLGVEPNIGSSSGEANDVTLSVEISGLGWGIHECNLMIIDPCALNNPQTVEVTVDIDGPTIEVSSADLEFDANESGTNPPDQMLTISNIGSGTLNWDISYDCNWLDVEPNSGSSTGETNDITLSVDINGLEWGLYDCNLTISDPNAENSPVTVNVSLEITEVWRNEIVFPDDPFNSEVVFESDPRWVKFHIKLDDPCTVYYQNSKLYPFHYHFATEWLEPFIGMGMQEYWDVTLYDDTNQLAVLGAVLIPPMEGNPPVPTFQEYAMQFIGYDPYTKEQIRDMFNVVKASVIADPCVQAFYFPTYEQLQVAEDNRAWFESEGIVIDSLARWIEGNIGYSEGWAIGELKYFPAGEIQAAYLSGQLTGNDILLTDGIPAEIPYVAGIISLSPSTPNSHVAILARTYGIPFVYLANDSMVDTAWELVGGLTLLCVREVSGVYDVRLSNPENDFTPSEILDLLAMKIPMPLDISPMAVYGDYSADTNALLPVDIDYFGGKASNYGILRRSIPDDSPVAVAFSFDLWNEFLDQPLTPSDSIIIDPCGYVLFWADNQSSQGSGHAGFKLSESGEDIGLFDTGTSLIDGLSYGAQTTDVSYGRTPDGNDSWTLFYGGDISPNAPNPGGGSGPAEGLFINEFMADNDNIVSDECGEYDDWLEIYNAGPTAVDLGGMYLTDDLDDPTNWMIPVAITGNTLREEIANRLGGYTYPPSDLAALSADLAAIRNIITNGSITSFSPALEDAIIAVLEDPKYGFDEYSKIRFRSSTNVEDSNQFTGAGLYDSFSGCLADDLDGDDAGPCACDPDESNERGVLRAIRKVFASFYNDNAFLERLRHDVNEAEVGMALLVHHSFPDEFELANGVATMERKESQSHWDIELVTQDGATPVTNPEQGAIPEEVSVYAESDGSVSMVMIRQSNLVILGETVMEWEQDYNDLVQLLISAAEEFETVTGKAEYILDFEYKKVAPGGAAIPAGGLVVKQIREIPQLDAEQTACPSIECTPPSEYYHLYERFYEDSEVSIETSYFLYCPGICKCADFSGFCRTTIRGYTTRPIIMFTGVAVPTYWSFHCSWLDFYFTPSQEPGMDQCLLNQLRAKNIRLIHLNVGGTPTLETFGFGTGPYYLGDFEPDGDVDMADFAVFSQRWLDSDCGLCGGVDLDCDEEVGLGDLHVFADNWLVGR